MKMQKKIILLSVLSMSSGTLLTMETQQQGPMNAQWFYEEQNPYKVANDLHQQRKWQEAAAKYEEQLNGIMNINGKRIATEYDQQMAKLNLAACLMAQRKPTEHWSSFDALIGINKKQLLSTDALENKDSSKSVLVDTSSVGIGDIAHFLEAAHELKKRTGWNVTVSVRPFLKDTIASVVQGYGCNLISDKDPRPETDYVTHIMGLYGHLKMDPAATKPDKILLAAPKRAMDLVKNQIDSVGEDKIIAAIFAGEDRQATLIGGKRLPYDQKNHGRQITPEAIKILLRQDPNLIIMDCGTPNSRIKIDEDQQNQYMVLGEEEQPFDTIVALARIMSRNKKIISLAADQGPSNVFARALNKEAQKRMAFIISNPDEHDMRMEGEGSVYKQMISDCWVLKSESSELNDQVAVLVKAIELMKHQ